MRFWDSSAIVPLLVPEPESKICRDLVEEDPELLVWSLTPTEILSALFRRVREGKLTEAQMIKVRDQLGELEHGWSEVIHWEKARQKANRLLAVHPLRAGDALQLAAAIIAFEEDTRGECFVTLDQTLAAAARREGLQVLP